jgi:hypothetical protein
VEIGVWADRRAGDKEHRATTEGNRTSLKPEKGVSVMKAGIFFTGSGPIVILTSYASLTESSLVEKLATKGIKKFVAFDVPLEIAKQKYGHHYNVITGDLHQEDDLRILDYDGHHVFNLFRLGDLGAPIYHEP